jgi:hypothetical protein
MKSAENSNEVMNEISTIGGGNVYGVVQGSEDMCVVKTTYLKKSSKSQNY